MMMGALAGGALTTRGPASRTVMLLIPKGAANPALEPTAMPTAATTTTKSTIANVSSSSSLGSSFNPASAELLSGVQMPKLLDPGCLEGLLGYARLLFAQPQGGKLFILGGAGPRLHTIISWDPGQQSIDSIVKGYCLWKPSSEKEFTAVDLQLAIHEAVQSLYEIPSFYGDDGQYQSKITSHGGLQVFPAASSKIYHSDPRKAISTARTRLIIMMADSWGAGGSADIYHSMILAELSKIDRAREGESCDALFLDVSSKDGKSSTSVCIPDTNSDIPLSTALYKLPPASTPDLLLDLAYLHLELSSITVKRLAAGLPTQMRTSSEIPSARNAREEDKASTDFNPTSELDLRFVLRRPSPLTGGYYHFPNEGELRNSRSSVLFRLAGSISRSELLEYTPGLPVLLEAPLSTTAAQIWGTVKAEGRDADGSTCFALGLDSTSTTVSHILVCLEESCSLHAVTDDAHIKSDDIAEEKGSVQRQGAFFPPEDLISSVPGNIGDDKSILSKKRGCEEGEDLGIQYLAPTVSREKKGPKQLERPARGYPWTTSESVIGGPDRHSATLAALLIPIRAVFMSDDPATELVNTATSCVSRLLELTEKNDGSLFPHAADIPTARKELYKKMWWELKRQVKRSRKDRTQEQEDLAQAIRAARTDFSIVEQQIPQPLPALTEKPAEHVHINKRRRCEEVPRDIHGRPIFPIKLGPSLQVYDLGNVVWNRPAFHSEKYIWPAGYKSRRAYASMLNSENRIFYWCEIVDDGQAPEFRLTPEDDENNPVIGISATAVWTVVVKRVGALRLEEGGKKTFANVSGPEYFGFANPTIARLIQQLPNSEMCSRYKRQDYFPNVPMRATELDAWQGAVANEGASSPSRKDSVMEGKDSNVQLPSSPPREQEGGDRATPDVEEDTGDPGGATLVPEEEEVIGPRMVEKPLASGGDETAQLRGMSWDSEEFRRARTKRGKLSLAEFSEQFLASNSGSLFSYYWSAKLKRATAGDVLAVELDYKK